MPELLYTPDDVTAAVGAYYSRAGLVSAEDCFRDVLDAVAPSLLARHLEALAVEHDTYSARTDARVPPESKTMARAFARFLRRHAATLNGRTTP